VVQIVLRGTPDELAAKVAQEMQSRDRRRLCTVIIEGLPGCGKSTLGRELSIRLNALHIELDDFLADPSDTKTPWHQKVIEGGARAGIRRSEGATIQIIEGVSSSRVVPTDILGAQETVRIYAKRMSLLADAGVFDWLDGHLLQAGEWDSCDKPTLNAEYVFHRTTELWKSAHIVVEVIEIA